MKKRKDRLMRRILMCLLICFMWTPVLTAGAMQEYLEESGTMEDAISVSGSDPGNNAVTDSFDAGDSLSVSGSDAGSNAVEESRTGLQEESFELVDISDMVYQEGGWGLPAGEYAIQSYAIGNENGLKSEIKQAMQNNQAELDVRKYDLLIADWNAVAKLSAAIINDNPELFYCAGTIGYSYFPSTGQIIKLKFYYFDYSEEGKRLYVEKLRQAAALVTPTMTDMEKALVLHDYLAQNCAYAKTEYLAGTLGQHMDFYRAYGALVEGRAVCNGYALAYDALLHAVGINSFTCSSKEMNHAWNIVQIDGEWYHVDVTWDDPTWNTEGRARHMYFLLSDGEITNREHSGWVSDTPCISAKYDSAWWAGVGSQIVVAGNSRYYIVAVNSGRGFQLKVRQGNSVSVKYSNSTVWEVWNGGGSFWTIPYAYLSRQGDTIYFNDKRNLYAMKLSDNAPQVIYTYSGGDGYIYGAMVYGDGTARLNIATTPTRESDSYITIDLKSAGPVLTANYINKTLPTTDVMEYSLDSGGHWTRCTDNMRLESFGWNGSREVSVLVRNTADSASGFVGKATMVTLRTLPGTIGGIVKYPGNKAGQTNIQIINRDGKMLYETKAGSNGEYVLQNVASGTYIMRVSRPPYVTREYSLTVAGQAVSTDIEIRLLGDTNGDGKIDAKDKKTLCSHIENPVLTGYEFLVGDVDYSEKIDARDKKIIFNHIAGSGPLW